MRLRRGSTQSVPQLHRRKSYASVRGHRKVTEKRWRFELLHAQQTLVASTLSFPWCPFSYKKVDFIRGTI